MCREHSERPAAVEHWSDDDDCEEEGSATIVADRYAYELAAERSDDGEDFRHREEEQIALVWVAVVDNTSAAPWDTVDSRPCHDVGEDRTQHVRVVVGKMMRTNEEEDTCEVLPCCAKAASHSPHSPHRALVEARAVSHTSQVALVLGPHGYQKSHVPPCWALDFRFAIRGSRQVPRQKEEEDGKA